MAVRQIVKYPDPVLTTPGDPVLVFDDSLRQLTDDMFETMRAAEGVGLAASQIGLSLRLFVMDCDGVRLVAANPEIISAKEIQSGQEGCLSLEEIFCPLSRPRIVGLRAQDIAGKTFEIEGQDLVARCLMHETDHCDGKLFISHLSPLQRDIVIRKLRKIGKHRSKRRGQ